MFKVFYTTVLLVLINVFCFGATDKYRIMITDDPSTTMTIGWNQISGGNGVVYFGKEDKSTNYNQYPFSQVVNRSTTYKGMNNRFVRLKNLEPNTAYYFVIKDNDSVSRRFWFKTCPNGVNDKLSFIAGGDSRNNREPRQKANTLVSKLKPHAVLFGGDMTNKDTNAEWLTWMNDWQLTIHADGRMIPIVPARGNHERSNAVTYNLFDVPSSNVYYALTFGDDLFRVYTLNTEMSIAGNQTTWLKQDLQANYQNVTWKYAQYHKPMRPHTEFKTEGNDQYNNWAKLFYDYDVKLVVESDSHTAKNTWPIRPTSAAGNDAGFVRDDANGTVYSGEGCWGAPLKPNNDDKSWTRASGMFNQFKWVFVSRDKIDIRTIKVDNAYNVGEVSDSDLFTAPANLDIWNPSSGAVVTIEKPLPNELPTVNISPQAGSNFVKDLGDAIALKASAQDTDGVIDRVEFYAGNELLGFDNSAPYSMNYNVAEFGSVTVKAVAVDNNGGRTEALSMITIENASPNTIFTFEQRISFADDDAEEGQSGRIYNNSGDLELVYDHYNSAGNQVVGLRYRSVTIPQGAVITNAYIQFTVDEAVNDAGSVSIQAEDNGSAAVIGTNNYNLSSRVRTNASVNWSPAVWNTVGQSGANQRTANIKSVIQEVVDRSDWSTSNNLLLLMTGTGRRVAESYNGSAAKAPLLYIQYQVLDDSQVDCNGDENGTANIDDCGVCAGGSTGVLPNTSCTDCAGIPNGVASIDDCGVCSGGLTGLVPNATCVDCAGVSNGTAVVDACGVCTGGTTGLIADASCSDCAGTANGSATEVCGVCTGGNTGVSAPDGDNDGIVDCEDDCPSDATNTCNDPVGNERFTIEKRISHVDDDAEESQSGRIYTNSGDLELVFDHYNSAGNQVVGLRFRDLDIPVGAIVTNAYVQFTVDETVNETGSLVIQAQATGNAPVITTATSNLSNRARTTASVNWLPSTWNTIGQAGVAQQTPNIKTVIQEVVSRSDWSSSNNLLLLVTGTGRRVAKSYNGSAAAAPLLHIEYELPVATSVDCAGVSNGTAVVDACGVCTGGTTGLIADASCSDCAGTANGSATEVCGVCTGGTTGVSAPDSDNDGIVDCEDDCLSDAANTCNDPVDCNGEVNGTAIVDDCGVCAGGATNVAINSSCVDCSGVQSWSSASVYPTHRTQVVFEGNLYYNRWYGNRGVSFKPGVHQVWKLVGACQSTSSARSLSVQESVVEVYPNPTNGVLNITPNAGLVQIMVHNSFGVLVYSTTTTSGSVNISHLPRGSYVVYVQDDISRTAHSVFKN